MQCLPPQHSMSTDGPTLPTRSEVIGATARLNPNGTFTARLILKRYDGESAVRASADLPGEYETAARAIDAAGAVMRRHRA